MKGTKWLRARYVLPILCLLGLVSLLVGPRGVDQSVLASDLVHNGLHGWGFRVLVHLRAPRVIVAATTGAALSVAGAVLQTWLRNPLADAGVLGVSSWGALGAVLAMFSGLSQVTRWAQPLSAVLLSCIALMVLLIAARRNPDEPNRLLLLGVGLGGIGSAMISLVLSLSLPDWRASRQIVNWLLGGLDSRTWIHASASLVLAIAGIVPLIAARRELDAFRLGPLEAASLGVDVQSLERRIVIATGLLAGSAAAGAGAIGFVGLIVPQLVRNARSAQHGIWMGQSALVGAAFLIAADLVARRFPGASEIQLGVITGLLGAPLLLRLLMKAKATT